jgi:hypothetical protein
VRHWNLHEIELPQGKRSPAVLHSKEGAERAVLIALRPGEALGDHGVKESALLLVLDGTVRVEAGDESVDADAGTLLQFEPLGDERRRRPATAAPRAVARRGPLPGRPAGRVRRQRFLAGCFCPCCSVRRSQRLYAKRSIMNENGTKRAV